LTPEESAFQLRSLASKGEPFVSFREIETVNLANEKPGKKILILDKHPAL